MILDQPCGAFWRCGNWIFGVDLSVKKFRKTSMGGKNAKNMRWNHNNTLRYHFLDQYFRMGPLPTNGMEFPLYKYI